MNELFDTDLRVVNVGLSSFADNFGAGGRACDRSLPGVHQRAAMSTPGWNSRALVNEPDIEEANRIAFGRYLEAQPVLVDVAARAARRSPPCATPVGCSTPARRSRGTTCAARCRAPSPARSCTRGGPIRPIRPSRWLPPARSRTDPRTTHAAVGPMAGIISPSMPVWVVENATGGNRSFCNLNEGLGKVLRFGANGPAVIERLQWMGTELYEVVQGAESPGSMASN